MKTPLIYFMLLPFILAIISCNKVIDISLDNATDRLVIEGNITDELGPQTIKLNTNVAVSNTNTYPPVTGATVTVNDQAGNVYKFTEGPAGTYITPKMIGVTGNTYTMNVVTNGKTYKASSVMPGLVALKYISSSKSSFNGNDGTRKITINYHDPKGVANQYNFLMYVNGVQVKRVFVNNDDFTDGNSVNFDLIENDIGINPGDKVTVEMQCIDKAMYTYWFALMQQNYTGPGGGVTPSDPPNNITPLVLGYFSAHTTQTKTITVK
ncbi:DUF4249 domain-containing protein [Mucilaginibacter lappiensis]|uniref:DUF4249 domain-containing protein n=1 Tax=Mucilaginibacter lappiensis TaxID=354630 RepID=A0A841JHS2_9SPHI|nr:DUF4249 domain-containing protein [Mucilaginibacter lappiensis]MBB6128208.1 hypothetical protein [Mucilaginibacter lappiensis]